LKVNETSLPGVLLIEPKVFGDERGFFFESWNDRVFREKTGLNVDFVQDNHSRSARGVLRGLHFQVVRPQGKLVRVSRGRVWDVAVDLRQSSAHFGQYVGLELSEANQNQLWIPPGFAHGFLVLSEFADFQYKTTDYWMPEHERGLNWRDPDIGIEWPSVDCVLAESLNELQAIRGKQREHQAFQLANKDRDAPRLEALKADGSLYD
jgi:dTDP-4-dehydrorhamnose 3,5-epimerase